MSIEHLAGHQFTGGHRTIEHWENFLLVEVCGGPQLADGIAHPTHLFHVPMDGAGVSIAELFELAEVEGPDRVGLESYDWEYFEPLREELTCRAFDGAPEADFAAATRDRLEQWGRSS